MRPVRPGWGPARTGESDVPVIRDDAASPSASPVQVSGFADLGPLLRRMARKHEGHHDADEGEFEDGPPAVCRLKPGVTT
jgi:hypothetical protein